MNFTLQITLGNVISAVAFLAGGGLAIWNLRGLIEKKFKEISVETNDKVSRIYKRFDEHKAIVDKKFEDTRLAGELKFQQEKICQIIHARMDRQFDEIKKMIREKT